MEEVGELSHSPPLVRRGRSRRANQKSQTTAETRPTQRAARTARSVLDDLQWSAPSSPVSDSGKTASEASAGGNLDPSLWQDFGSAFHTAFSLLGGEDSLPMTMSDALPTTDATEAPNPPVVEETEEPYDIDDVEITQPAAVDSVTEGDGSDVILISSQEEDSDNMTLLQIKEHLASSGRGARGGKGGRGKARGRGRGRGRSRGKSKGRGRGRGRVEDLQSSPAGDEDVEEVVLVNPSEQQHVQEEENELSSLPVIEKSHVHVDVALSPPQQSSSDCLILDSDSDHITNEAPSQFDDAPEEGKEHVKIIGDNSSISDSEGYDSNALHCICRQKHDKRFMICCDSCQVWFHGDCVGISATQGRDIERKGQDYICPPCTTKKQSQIESELHPQPVPEVGFPECLTLGSPCEERVGQEEQQAPKYTVVEEEEKANEEEEVKDEQTPVTKPETKPEAEMETGCSLPLCIGPGCSKQALPDSVYCGTDCILQHAAVTMKTLSGPKVPKPRGRTQRKAATGTPTAKAQRSGRMSKRLAGKVEEEGEEEERIEDDGEKEAAASPVACGPSLTEAQTTSIPSSKICTAFNKDGITLEAESEVASPSNQCQEGPSTDSSVLPLPAAEAAPPQRCAQEKVKEPVNGGVSKQKSAQSDLPIPPTTAKSSVSTDTFPTASSLRHHETGALMVTKTSYVIPKKQSGSQSPSSHVSASASCQKPLSAPTLLNETRNLPVSPAPSAPSSRPSQPNNQVRQSIQRSLTGILFKRVCDCEDLEMTESEAAKLVASIEMEMFDIFRNTDSKYMNKYRTIMFNLKDPRNKGLLYRVVHGEIGPFRLVRMSQKDMQATKAPEPSVKETTEVKDTAAKVTSLQKPEAVKVDLPSLNPARIDRKPESTERKLPAPAPKTKSSQPSQGSAVPDILSCMLKDTTSEHKTHLFDLKCKICTGQMLAVEEEEPAKKKNKVVAVSREKREPPWKRSAGDDSPLRAPPDSPDMDSPTSSMDTSSCLFIDSPALTIVESPASPIKDSPASPTSESPASPIMESPASPTPDTSKATARKRAYTPVVIPAVSTVTITRRDPRTAASRCTASSSSTSGYTNPTHKQAAPYAPVKETAASHSQKPPPKTLPKSILMKPSSTSDPRLYGTSSRAMISESSADGETAQFLAKQDILWKGFVNMLTVAKFVTKGYLVSGSAENLKADLPDTIQIGGRIMPQTVWDYVAKLKTSVTKELCVIRFHPATEEEEVAYVSLFSYFSSRGRFGVVANNSHSIKDVYLVPLSAKESIPSILQPLVGPGLEKNRPNVLLGLAVVQKIKRSEILPQEFEEKRPKVHMSKDPMWIPKPPVLYGSDKLEIFQPYDPETPASTTPPGSPSCPGSPIDSSTSGSVTITSHLTCIQPPVSALAVTQSTSNSISENNSSTASSSKTPLQTILKSLFGGKQSDSVVTSDGSSNKTESAKKTPVFSQVSGSMMDPIVQQYGQKSKVKELQEEENYLDRPYDPEEEYNPEMGYKTVAPQAKEERNQDVKAGDSALSGSVEDDVAYDPEDDSIFEDIQSNIAVSKSSVPTQRLGPASCPTTASTSTSVQISTPAAVMTNLPTGTVVVSAATLSEQQRMLEELNKQIEEQKRQLKEQEEALRQQREAVGMFMAHFSVSDSLMSPPQKSSSQQPSLQSGILKAESKHSESAGKSSNHTENVDNTNLNTQPVKLKDTSTIQNDTNTLPEQDETQENIDKSDKYSSAGEIEDSDVAYDPEDESLFNEIQGEVFEGGSIKTGDSLFRFGRRASHKGTSPNSHRSRKRRSSPKRRSHRDRGHNRSPSRRSQHRSPSHSQRHRDKDRHRRSERDRSRHRVRDPSDRQGRHRKDHTSRRHSHGRRRSPSSPRKKDGASLSPKPLKGPFPEVIGESKHALHSTTSSSTVTIKKDPDGQEAECDLVESPDKELSLCSHELHTVKLEISEPSTFQDLQKSSVSNLDNIVNHSSALVDENSQQKTLFQDKIESTVPLREIDPPIRDSPQSPDPEPQSVKPVKNDISDSDMMEKIGDAESHCPTIGDQTTVSSKLCYTVRDPLSNVRGVGLSSENIVIPNISSPIPHIQDRVLDGQGKHMREQGTFMQCSEPNVRHSVIQNCNTDIGGSWPVMRGSEMRSSVQDEESSCVQRISAEAKEPSPDMRQKLEQAVPCVDKDRGGPLMKGPLSVMLHNSQMEGPVSRTGVMKMGTEQSFKSPQLECRALDIIEDGRGKNDERDYSPSRVQRQSRPDGIPVVEESGPQKRGFQPHGKDGGISKMGGGQDRHFDLNTSASSGERLLRADRLSPAVERLGPPRGQEIHLRGAESILDCKSHTSNMPYTEQEIPRSDVRAERSMRGLEFRDSETMHDIKKTDMRGRDHFRSCGDIGNLDPNLRDADTQGMNRQSTWLERTNEQIGQEDREISNNTNPGWRCPGPRVTDPNVTSQLSQNKNQGPHMRDPDWNAPGTDVRNNWRGSDRRGSGPVRGESFIQDDWRLQQSDRRGPNFEIQGHNRRPAGSLEFRQPESEIRGPNLDAPRHDNRGPSGPDIRGKGPDRRGPEGPDIMGPERREPIMGNQGSGLRGPGDQEFVSPGLGRKGLAAQSPDPGRRGPIGPHFRVSGPERRYSGMEGQGPDKRGPPGHDNRGPWPERGGPDMIGPGPDTRGSGGPGPERRVPGMEGSGIDRRGLEGPDFRGHWPESRCLSVEGPQFERRPRGKETRRAECEGKFSVEHPGHENRGPGDFRAPRTESRGLFMDCPGSERIGFGGPDFREPGPDSRGSAVGSVRLDRRVSGGPDFIRQENEMRGTSMDSQNQKPDMRGPRGPDFCGPGSNRRSLSMDGPGSQGSGGHDSDRRGPYMGGAELDYVRLGSERTGPDMEGPGPHSRGHGGPHWDCGTESGHPNMAGMGPGRRGPDLIEPWMERPGSGMDIPMLSRKGPVGSKMVRPGPQHAGPPIMGQEADCRFTEGPAFTESRPDRGPPAIASPHSDRRGPQFGGMGADRPVPGVQWPIRKGPDCRGSGCESRGPDPEGPGPDRKEQGGSIFRGGPGSVSRGPDLEGLGPDRRRPGVPDFRGTGIKHQGPNIEGPHYDRRDDWRGSESIQEIPNLEVPGSVGTRQNFKGSRSTRRDPRGPDFRGFAPETRGMDTDDKWSDRKGPIMESLEIERGCPGDDWESYRGNSGPIQEGPGKLGQEHNRQGPHNNWRGPENRETKPIQERRNRPFPTSGPGDDWNGPGCRGPGPIQGDPDMVFPAPMKRGDGGPFCRGERGPNKRGQGYGRGQGRKLGPDMQGNDERQPDFKGSMRGPNMEGPGVHRSDPDLMYSHPNRREYEMEGLDRRGPGGPDLGPPGLGNRNSNIGGPGCDGRVSDYGDLGPEMRVDMGLPGQGFEHEFRKERRGSKIRRLDPNKSDVYSDPYLTPADRSRGPDAHNGGKPFPDFDNPQNQKTAKPQRHRGALLPTPTEGLIRFPNQQFGHPTDTGQSRGRPWNRQSGSFRGRGRGPVGPARRMRSPGGGGEEANEHGSENDK
ncbi:uncharacterized protein LOC125010755 isoform X2 [Mugil cephalus]|nr:uncharacterized protein LOC125010755 isoform X2 [Mugil cephalus]XP_047445537.1 uncharacterized protein LOC125010755 isoform X2 [Mugil cephalus]